LQSVHGVGRIANGLDVQKVVQVVAEL
jgi:hypothetical protein